MSDKQPPQKPQGRRNTLGQRAAKVAAATAIMNQLTIPPVPSEKNCMKDNAVLAYARLAAREKAEAARKQYEEEKLHAEQPMELPEDYEDDVVFEELPEKVVKKAKKDGM